MTSHIIPEPGYSGSSTMERVRKCNFKRSTATDTPVRKPTFYFDYAVLRSVREHAVYLLIPILAGSNDSRTSHSKAGPLAGGIVGGLLVIALLLLGWYFWKRKRATAVQHAKQQPYDPEPYIIPVPVRQSGPTTVSHSVGVNSSGIVIHPARTLDSDCPVSKT
ncbi:hypothetical protein M422DRAFT_268070 [Sphaerobolus stellatus SS14]|uniref:Uncharacterized protein n=1 Tax=Sphaerobolus stellatus (strain SS14) TaxID=990650 RepID=A0A0C9UNK3_SPHS4|nr:hypothetical protein M422DRAFT_268070 [Sphaerobolus stellatus SS14]